MVLVNTLTLKIPWDHCGSVCVGMMGVFPAAVVFERGEKQSFDLITGLSGALHFLCLQKKTAHSL